MTVTGEPVELTRQRVEEFAGAVRHSGGGVPPTIAAPLTADLQQEIMNHPDLRIDLSRTLHTGQSFAYHRPLVVGDVLTATATVTSVRPMRSGRTITFATEVADESGAVVQTLVTSLLTEEAPS